MKTSSEDNEMGVKIGTRRSGFNDEMRLRAGEDKIMRKVKVRII